MLGLNNATPPGAEEQEKSIDFGATVLQADVDTI